MKQKNEPAISVIMSIYNQKNPEYLRDAITSVLKQTFDDFEFIIYSDGSDDDVVDKLNEYARMDERIIVINNPVNYGLAYSLNACIDVARGKYLARMDDDDICDIRRLSVQYDYLERHPEIAFVGCNATLFDADGIWGHRLMPEHPDKNDFLKFSPFIHPSVMIRRSIMEAGNTYNTVNDTLRCEDYELFMRLLFAGYQGHNIQQELFYYREDSHSYFRRRLKHRLAEMRIRHANFKNLGLLTPKGYLYVLRPLLSAMVPAKLILQVKKLYHKQRINAEYEEGIPVPQESEKSATII